MSDYQSADPLATPACKDSNLVIEAAHEEAEESEQAMHYDTPEELLAILRERHTVDMSAEDMDPLEYGFRKVVPIPAHYYWDVCRSDQDVATVPVSIKAWHVCLSSLTRTWQWTERSIGKPVVNFLGLTNSRRLHDVTMFMSEDDWKTSERIVSERSTQSDGDGGEGGSTNI